MGRSDFLMVFYKKKSLFFSSFLIILSFISILLGINNFRVIGIAGSCYYNELKNYEKSIVDLLMNVNKDMVFRTLARSSIKIKGHYKTKIFIGQLSEILIENVNEDYVQLKLIDGILAIECVKSSTPFYITSENRKIEICGTTNKVMIKKEKRFINKKMDVVTLGYIIEGEVKVDERVMEGQYKFEISDNRIEINELYLSDFKYIKNDFCNLLDDDFISYERFITSEIEVKEIKEKKKPGEELIMKDEIPPILVITRVVPEIDGIITLYGYTEPNVTVEVDGYPIDVLPDGSFRQRLDFIKPQRIPEIIARDLAGNENRYVLTDIGDYYSLPQDFEVTANPSVVDAKGPGSQIVNVRARFITSSGKTPSPTFVRFEAVSATGKKMGEILGSNVVFTDFNGEANIQFRPGYFPGQAFMRVYNHTNGEELGSTSITLRDAVPDRVPGSIIEVQNSIFGNNTLLLTWSGGNIEEDLFGYRVYKNSCLVATYPIGTTSYYEDNLIEDEVVTYEIRAIDIADPLILESESLSKTITIKDNSAPIVLGAGGVTGATRYIDVTFSEDLSYNGNYTLLTVFPGDVPLPKVMSNQFIGNGTVRLGLDADLVLYHSYELEISDAKDDGSIQNTMQPNPTRVVINY
ncbi:MAG: hypothetical protein AB1765_12065 [Candidatus Hydrogenedentota bacterium]